MPQCGGAIEAAVSVRSPGSEQELEAVRSPGSDHCSVSSSSGSYSVTSAANTQTHSGHSE